MNEEKKVDHQMIEQLYSSLEKERPNLYKIFHFHFQNIERNFNIKVFIYFQLLLKLIYDHFSSA